MDAGMLVSGASPRHRKPGGSGYTNSWNRCLQRDAALRILQEHAEELGRTFGIGTLALFGSVAGDEAGPESDVDVLVELADDPTFSGYMGLKFRLQELFGRQVDLVTLTGLRPCTRPYVEQDLIRVA
jgi:uncharacterized protein